MTSYRSNVLLSIEDVHLSFDDKTILDGVNVQIQNLGRSTDDGKDNQTGQVVAFLGPSGVGKTQLLRILAGLQKPTSGEVYLGGERTKVRRGSVGMVSQQYVLYRNRTVMGNLMIAAKQRGLSSADAKIKSTEMLVRFDLVHRADMYPSQLSGGQRQRVAIAQQLLCSEHFLLMDEPTAGLDPISKKTVCSFVSQVANQHDLNTIIVVTHDIRAAISMADTLWLMGRDRDAQGNIISGAKIKKEYDLIERGLTWNPDVMEARHFVETEREIVREFEQL